MCVFSSCECQKKNTTDQSETDLLQWYMEHWSTQFAMITLGQHFRLISKLSERHTITGWMILSWSKESKNVQVLWQDNLSFPNRAGNDTNYQNQSISLIGIQFLQNVELSPS